jgi:hypothetical protein
MSQISIMGDEGEPVLYASLTSEGNLFFQFEYLVETKTKAITSSTTQLRQMSFQELPINSD